MTIFWDNLDKLISISVLISGSLYLRFVIQFLGQSWVKSQAHTATLFLLPLLTYIITSVISGNIALSLGMVGALSIVRFRNPVRSPLELSVYFGAITMGIAAAVSLLWLIFLIGSVTIVGLVLWLASIAYSRIMGEEFFITSFTEGIQLSSLQVRTSASILELNDSKFLVSKTRNGDEWDYMLTSSDFAELQKLEAKIADNQNIQSISLTK